MFIEFVLHVVMIVYYVIKIVFTVMTTCFSILDDSTRKKRIHITQTNTIVNPNSLKALTLVGVFF